MKVLHCLSHFLPYNIAGTEVYVMALMKNLSETGIQSSVIIPNYGKEINEVYNVDGFKVFQYSELSVKDRELQMGNRAPDGLKNFEKLILKQDPDIIHFHEIAGSNGFTIHHVDTAKQSGSKILFTFHLSVLSCMTGTLMQRGQSACDGKIDLKKCTQCYLKFKNINPFQQYLLSNLSYFLKKFDLDTRRCSNKWGTALGTTFLIEKKKKDLNRLVDKCDKVIVLTKWYREILLANGISDDKILFIPQGLPGKHFLENSYNWNPPKLKFIFVGRISKFKGLHLLIDAFQKLNSNAIQLDIFGQADDEEYESNLKKLTLNNPFIVWKGVLLNSEVVAVMSNYNALCLPSTTSEMSPLVIQEAFAAGIPVIASNVYGNTEQIKHEVNALLFNFNDSTDLLKQLQRCIDEKELLLTLSRNILPPRTFEGVANDHVKLYNSLMP